MKRLISFCLCISILACSAVAYTFAASGAEIRSDSFEFSATGKYGISEINVSLDELQKNTTTKEKLAEKYGTQLRQLDVYACGIDDIYAIYGIQLSVSVNSSEVALGYIETNLQNGSKVGYSKWDAYLSSSDGTYKTAKLLMYGSSQAVNSEVNKSVNMVESNKYRIATIYYFVSKNIAKDFTITYKVEDIASKNSQSAVVSTADKFKKETVCKASIKKTDTSVYTSVLGAQVRVTGLPGLRFGTKVYKAGYISTCTDISYGTLISVTNQLNGKELTLDTKTPFYNSTAKVYSEKQDYIIFTGEVVGLPASGQYDTVNFTARGYVKFKAPGSSEYTVIYTEPIVRNIEQIKSIIGMK